MIYRPAGWHINHGGRAVLVKTLVVRRRECAVILRDAASRLLKFFVMAGLVPAIHVFLV
jgi:hypothetical protein